MKETYKTERNKRSSNMKKRSSNMKKRCSYMKRHLYKRPIKGTNERDKLKRLTKETYKYEKRPVQGTKNAIKQIEKEM